jgi:Domain of unknown function (DUF4149)
VSGGGAMSSDGAKKEPWITPRLHNTAAFRSLALLGAITAAGWSSQSPLALLSAQATAALHLFSFATWFGTMVYTTFVLGITMFKNLPRQTFGKLQAKLFPMYFALSSVTIVLQVRSFKLYALSSFGNGLNLCMLLFSLSLACNLEGIDNASSGCGEPGRQIYASTLGGFVNDPIESISIGTSRYR